MDIRLYRFFFKKNNCALVTHFYNYSRRELTNVGNFKYKSIANVSKYCRTAGRLFLCTTIQSEPSSMQK